MGPPPPPPPPPPPLRGSMSDEWPAAGTTGRRQDDEEPPVVRVQVVEPEWPRTTHIFNADSVEVATHLDAGAWHRES